jgi:DNA replication and repair protein RecF
MISSLRLQNFRLYDDSLFEFDEGVNIIVGPNACGKTSLIEGVLILSQGSSYRARDVDLIKFKKKWARLEGGSEGHQRIVKITNDPLLSKTISIDGKDHRRLNLNQKIPLVLFEPNDILMLSGSPDTRRDYLDRILKDNTLGYKTVLAKYNRALAQRNSLLKTIDSRSIDKLFPWNIRLSQLGGQVVSFRSDLINKLNKQLPDMYKQLSSSKIKIAIKYLPQIDIEGFETKFLHKLDNNAHEDLHLGFTRYGPHRDDFVLAFNNHPTNVYASRGEARTATLALKLAEHQLIKEQAGTDPIFLLDDVFSELDGHRRRSLAKYLLNHQSFITTTDADIAIKQFSKHRKILPLGRAII